MARSKRAGPMSSGKLARSGRPEKPKRSANARKRRRQSRQQSLNLYLGRRGGYREHAGRPRGPRPLVWHRSRKDFPETHPCHVTLKVRAGLPSLRQWHVVREVEARFRAVAAGAIAGGHARASAGGGSRTAFRLVHYSIQDDHAHLIVEAESREALGRGMKSLASRFAFAVNRGLGRVGRVLADRYHLRILRSPRQVRNALVYVLLNARRHAAQRVARRRKSGLRAAPIPRAGVLDAASSARWFPGWRGDRAVDRSPPRSLGALPAVAEPRTWFLRVGWRRFGLLDPNEVPGGLGA
jgi:REP-associated tyrosine transposase